MYKTAKDLYVGIRYQVNDTTWIVDQIKFKNDEATVYASLPGGEFGYSVTLKANELYFKIV